MNFWKDLLEAYKEKQLWMALGWNDVLGRYRRSILGPLWITLSMLVTICAVGPLYGMLFGNKLSDFIPTLALGLIFWSFISSTINESCTILNDSANYLKQISLPYSMFTLRVIYRQIIILLHNLILVPLLFLVFWKPINFNILFFIPSLIITLTFLFGLSTLISIFCTRYRDMVPVIQSLVGLLFFITPIIWSIDQLPPERQHLIAFNALSIYIDLLKKPLLGQMPTNYEFVLGTIIAFCAFFVSLLVLNKCKHRINYWI